MAALTVGHCWCSRKTTLSSNYEFPNRRNNPKIFLPLCCQGSSRRPASNSSNNEEKKLDTGGGGKLKWKVMVMNGFEKLIGKRPQQNLSPQQKGDWKDLFLMSVSFAVYVYISQKLVCAYCAWTTSMPKQMW